MKLFYKNRHVKLLSNCLAITIMILLLNSCATSQFQVSKKQQVFSYPNQDSVKLKHTFYLIGDAGNAQKDSTTLALKVLSNTINNSAKDATVLYLGDNVYPAGIPKKESSERELAEHRLSVQIDAVKNFKGKTIFIPGNHDWYNEGVKGLKREQEFVENKLGKNSFLPKDGCPIKTIDIDSEIVLIVIDSEWFITNWDKHPTINTDCEIKTRTQFLDEIRNEIKKARGKTTLIAIHHPMFSNGPHGGKYSFKNYLNPIPIVGSLKNLIRQTSGVSPQDIQGKRYSELRDNIIAASKHNDKVIFVSGHEHSLQYLVHDNIPQIISGSGSKTTPTRNVGDGKYSHSTNGYAVLEIYDDGSSYVKFIQAKTNTTDFTTQVLKPNTKKNTDDFSESIKNSIKSSIYTNEETKKSKFYKFLWGERYRKYYSTEILAKTVNLDTLFGGVTPVRKGGGNQSKALRLKTKSGKQYVMRAMKKNAAQYIQASLFKNQYVEDQFYNTSSEALVKDVFTASHPYASFVIPTLSKAIGIYHLNPKLYYIPKQKALGDFNSEFGDELYLVEEFTSNEHIDIGGPNFTGNFLNTNEVINQIQSDESVSIDEEAYIKARLFDMLIGDWDRHQDQWRWMEFKENDKIVYKPLPRDRDQAFSIMSDGFVLSAAVKLIPAAKLLRKYSPDLKDVKGFNTEPYPLDKALIKKSTKTHWDNQVLLIQNNITKEVIDKAFNQIPKEVNDKTIDGIKNILEQRKKNLQKIADRYFNLLSKSEVITATNKDDVIKIQSLENGEVEVTLFRKKKDNVNEQFFTKKYYPRLTKEIWIYGLDDKDSFKVIGKSKKIKIRLIGGQNEDEYAVEKGKNVIIYDYKSKKNDVSNTKNASVRLQDNYEINVYNYKKLKTNIRQIIPSIGSNPDDGFKIGASAKFTHFGFERNPFTRQHTFKGAYFFATEGFEISYKGEFANVIGNLNLEVKSELQSPNFSQNFFGYGNESQNFDDDFGLDYNRVKISSFKFSPSLKWYGNSGGNVAFGINFEILEVDNILNRFVNVTNELNNTIFDEAQFIGAEAKYEFENYDNKAYPTLGMKTALTVGYKSNTKETSRNYSYIIPEISFDHKIDSFGRLVLATKLKSQINIGNNFEFYQGAAIGGFDGLRGYRNQRFVGNQSFYQNTDLRYSFSKMKTKLLPIRLGVYSGFDYGRVWFKGEESQKWNTSYGGGFFINGAELLNTNLGVFSSKDGIRVAFGLGFTF